MAKVHTQGYAGPRSKNVNVETNDPDHPQVNLLLSFDVQVPVEVRPPALNLYASQGDPFQNTVLVLHRQDGKSLEVKSATPSDPSLKVAIEPVTDKNATAPPAPDAAEKGDVRLRFTVEGGSTQQRNLNGTVRLVTNHPEKPETTVPFYLNVVALLRAVPPRLDLSRFDPNAAAIMQVSLFTSNKPFKITGVDLRGDLPGCKPTIVSNGNAAAQVVRLECTGPMPAAGIHGGTLIATTDLALSPTIEVPVALRVTLPQQPAAPPAQAPAAVRPAGQP